MGIRVGLESQPVLLVQRPDVAAYPPTIHQANLLAEAGLRVVVADGAIGARRPAALADQVELIRAVSREGPAAARHSTPLSFLEHVRGAIQRLAPSVVVAYDSTAVIAVGALLRGRHRRVFHFHEHPAPEPADSLSMRLQHAMAAGVTSLADLVVVPDSDRADVMFESLGLRTRPSVVFNCPRRLDSLPPNKLRAALQGRVHPNQPIVIHQGSIARNLSADLIVKSMRWWPPDAVVVFLGPIRPEFQSELLALASDLGVRERLFILPPVPFTEVMQYTAGATIGLGIIQPISDNYRYISGASNKRFEYMACGVPQIGNEGPGMTALLVRNGAGRCVDPNSAEQLGQTVSDLLSKPELLAAMGKTGRRLHLEKFNYEYQFAPVLDWIRRAVRTTP